MKFPAALAMLAGVAHGKDAFVFLGATGDNAMRDSGVWQGLFEAYAGGVYDAAGGVDIFCPTNQPHTEAELRGNVVQTLTPLYEKLSGNDQWKCLAKDGCSVQDFSNAFKINIWENHDACPQAQNMTADLAGYDRISVYLSIPPAYFGEWADCVVQNWGADRVHIAAEKPFGTDLANADELHQSIVNAVPDDQLHLVDHWLSFFMNKNLPYFRGIVEKALGVSYDRKSFSEIVVTEIETRGLEGRGGFFDGVGQVRDMVQSHLLQVLGLVLKDPSSTDPAQKFNILNATTSKSCEWGQYDGFLLEPKLSYHPDFADSTWVDVLLTLDLPQWYSVPMHIVTGKDMGMTQYTVEMYQRDGPGVLTFEIGKEETGVAGIKVTNWPLVSDAEFQAPVGGFANEDKTVTRKPNVDKDGNGYILDYTTADMYFPDAYAVMLAALLSRQYDVSFATYPECRRGWEIITMTSADLCMDPAPENVPVYQTPDQCGNTPPNVCWQVDTVKDKYDTTFACTAANDAKYVNISLYQAKCHPSA